MDHPDKGPEKESPMTHQKAAIVKLTQHLIPVSGDPVFHGLPSQHPEAATIAPANVSNVPFASGSPSWNFSQNPSAFHSWKLAVCLCLCI